MSTQSLKSSLNRRNACRLLATGAASLPLSFFAAKPEDAGAQNSNRERIKAFCVDFNWHYKEGRFAPPGMYSDASASEHFAWYRDLGVNTIQTFCVSCCGYAWYQSGVAPVNPGMKGDFLTELTELGQNAGMRVMGYFCIGANPFFCETHPDITHGIAYNTWNIPFTKNYLDYLCRTMEDALIKTPIDGFMVDWLWTVKPKWLDCEIEMYRELFDEPFPGKDKITEETTTEFMRRSTGRAWKRIYKVVKATRSDAIIWLSCYNLKDPQVAGSDIFKETDWLMNEHPDPATLAEVRLQTGPNTRIIQCLCGWGPQHDAAKVISDPAYDDVGFYGFAKPDLSTLPPAKSDDPTFAANAKNIEIMRQAFRKG